MSSFYRASITKYHNLYTALFWFCQAGMHRLHFPQSCTCLACLHVRSDPAYKLARFANLQISPDVQNIHHSTVRGPVEIAAIGYKVCTRRSGGLDCYHSGHPDHETRELSAFEAHCDRVSLGTHAIVALCERVARQMTVNDGSVSQRGPRRSLSHWPSNCNPPTAGTHEHRFSCHYPTTSNAQVDQQPSR